MKTFKIFAQFFYSGAFYKASRVIAGIRSLAKANVNFLLASYARAKAKKDPMARKMACKQIDPSPVAKLTYNAMIPRTLP